jgi:prefoldin subunit 5
LRRDHRDELYAQIRVVFEDLNEKQSDERQSFEQECTDNYDNLTKKVNDCFELVLGLTDFKMIRETLINVQSEVRIAKLKRGQRNELFARIREAFGIFDKKRDEFFSERRAERIEKLNDIKSNLSEKIERLNQAIESEKAELVQLEGKSAEEMDEFMKNETTQRITLVQGKISEKEQSIEQTRKRIEEVDADIAKIEKSKEDS